MIEDLVKIGLGDVEQPAANGVSFDVRAVGTEADLQVRVSQVRQVEPTVPGIDVRYTFPWYTVEHFNLCRLVLRVTWSGRRRRIRGTTATTAATGRENAECQQQDQESTHRSSNGKPGVVPPLGGKLKRQSANYKGSVLECLCEDILVKADQVSAAHTNGWCPHVAGRPQHGFDRILADFRIDVELGYLLALHGDQSTGIAQQLFCILCLQFPAGRDGFVDGDVTGFQEPGCFGTGCSSLAEVIPLSFVHLSHLVYRSDVPNLMEEGGFFKRVNHSSRRENSTKRVGDTDTGLSWLFRKK